MLRIKAACFLDHFFGAPKKHIFAALFFLLTFHVACAGENIDVKSQYLGRDFSSLLKPKSEFLGYIGSDYQRLRITFTSIAQDKKDHAVYRVRGYSVVKANTNGFEGIIVVDKISRLREMHYGADDELKNAGIQAEGILTAKYELRENPEQKHSGKFTGTMTLNWYVPQNGKLLCDDIEDYSDNYNNNQYAGIWTAYKSRIENKVANWGEYRIPFSGDLDIGAGEFSANPKYKDRGW